MWHLKTVSLSPTSSTKATSGDKVNVIFMPLDRSMGHICFFLFKERPKKKWIDNVREDVLSGIGYCIKPLNLHRTDPKACSNAVRKAGC